MASFTAIMEVNLIIYNDFCIHFLKALFKKINMSSSGFIRTVLESDSTTTTNGSKFTLLISILICNFLVPKKCFTIIKQDDILLLLERKIISDWLKFLKSMFHSIINRSYQKLSDLRYIILIYS